MTQAVKAQEPSMEEILASIRRIIADDDAAKPGPKLVETAPKPVAVPKPAPAPVQTAAPAAAAAPATVATPAPETVPAQEPGAMNQEDIDAVLAGFDKEPEPAPQPEPKESADVLDLTEAMEAKAEAAPAGFRTIDANSDVVFAERPAAPEPKPAPTAREPEPTWTMPQEAFDRPPLLSHNTQAAVTTAFGSLAHTVLAQNARTLDDLVRDMLRPMLKSWLDDNLPTIVERMVRAEIERVSRGR